jgi:UDP-N-acetylglucosamine 2-epimerase (non-hydrolysing)
MKKILTIFGTRPEAIKLAPVIKELERRNDVFVSKVCVTAQHREMLDPFLQLFGINPDWDLNIMQPNQSLFDVTAKALIKLKEVLEKEKPDLVLVQGDTTTTFTAALAAYYLKIKVGHIADLHFAPTKRAKENLLSEGIPEGSIFVTGNTVVDALFMILARTKSEDYLPKALSQPDRKLILVTAHRRESFGEGIANICLALKEIVKRVPDVEIVYPVHLNPNVREPVYRMLSGMERVHLIEPLDYISFVHLMKASYLILTDSGGIQEEAPSLGKPVLVLRNTTERPEAVEAGAAKLVGTDPQRIVAETLRLLQDPSGYSKMANVPNPFGDGKAALRIVDILESFLG